MTSTTESGSRTATPRKESWQSFGRESGRIGARSGVHTKTAGTSPREGHAVTLREHVERYLEVHATIVEPSTVRTISERLGVAKNGGVVASRRQYTTPIDEFGDLTLAELEQMSAAIALWQTTLPPRYRHAIMSALRQVLTAALRWGLMSSNPAIDAGRNPTPPVREMAYFRSLAEVDRLAAALGDRFGPIAVFGVETGLRPEEWTALQHADLDDENRTVSIRRVCVRGRMRDQGKTRRFRRDVPLTARAMAALDSLPPRVDTNLLFPAALGGPINLNNFRNRCWGPAVREAGLDPRLTPYSMRHTFASFALAAQVSIFELARMMGTSVQVIDATYGHLVRDSHERVRDALEARARTDLLGSS